MNFSPEFKECETCRVEFWPDENMKPQNWVQAKHCKKHRKNSNRGPSNIPGHYEVKSVVIDKFLRGGL